jgi:PilZ domain-containing protein
VSFVERRRAHRFELQSPLIVRWKEGERVREALTVSEDVSSNGIYFVLPEGIQDGTAVEVEITLPNQITLAGPVRVRCLGRIQRCEPTPGAKSGMAAAIEKYEFLPGNEEASWEKSSPEKSKS